MDPRLVRLPGLSASLVVHGIVSGWRYWAANLRVWYVRGLMVSMSGSCLNWVDRAKVTWALVDIRRALYLTFTAQFFSPDSQDKE